MGAKGLEGSVSRWITEEYCMVLLWRLVVTFFGRHRHYQARERFDIRLLLQSKERGVRAIWRRERKLVRGLRGKEVLGFHAGVSIRKLGIP